MQSTSTVQNEAGEPSTWRWFILVTWGRKRRESRGDSPEGMQREGSTDPVCIVEMF